MDLIMSTLILCALFSIYDPLIITIFNMQGQNTAILPSFLDVKTLGDIATPPVYSLWKNRLLLNANHCRNVLISHFETRHS